MSDASSESLLSSDIDECEQCDQPAEEVEECYYCGGLYCHRCILLCLDDDFHDDKPYDVCIDCFIELDGGDVCVCILEQYYRWARRNGIEYRPFHEEIKLTYPEWIAKQKTSIKNKENIPPSPSKVCAAPSEI